MSLEERLIEAADRGDREEVHSLLDQGADVNAKDRYHNTPAARNGYLDIVNILIARGALVNATNDHRYTPLLYTTQAENCGIEIIRSLINHGAEVTPEYGSNYTILHRVCETSVNQIDIIKLLVNHKTNLNVKTDTDYTPLHFIAIYGHTEAARLFLQYGADPNIKNKHGDTPLYRAAFHNHIKTFFLLLLYGAGINEKEREEINNKSDLKNCLEAFNKIKELPHLGGLIEAHKNKDTKAISKYINNVKNQEALIEEFKEIKERCTNEQLSFVPEYLSDFVEHMILNHIINHQETNAIRAMAHLANNPTKNKIDVPEEMFENIASYLNNQSLKNLHLAYHMSTDEDYGRAMNLLKRMKATESVLDQPGAVGLENLFLER